MTLPELFDWLKRQGCEITPKEGINNTTPAIEVVNKKNNRFSYFGISIIVSRRVIEKLIRDLGIEPPAGF